MAAGGITHGSDDLSEEVEQLSLSDSKALQLKQEYEKEVFPSAAVEPISIIRKMWNTVLDHENGYINGDANTTYLVCTINGKSGRICIQSGDGTHAEKKLTDYLEAKYIATPNVTCTITVYINNSPCHMCAQKLKEFLQKFENIELVLYVTHLYKIRRLSCQLNWVVSSQKNDRHMGYIDVNDYEKNYQGLKDLMNLGENRCRIDAFTEDVWKALHEVMDIVEELKQTMMTKYTKTPNEEHVRSRNREDLNITQDLTYLRKNSDPWQAIAKIKYYKTN